VATLTGFKGRCRALVPVWKNIRKAFTLEILKEIIREIIRHTQELSQGHDSNLFKSSVHRAEPRGML